MIQEVRIAEGHIQKYVILEVLLDGETTDVLWGNPKAEWHKNIVDEIEREAPVISILGGGRIFQNPETKTIYIWGKSDRYGLAPEERAERLLESAFPEYTIFRQEPS